MSVILVTGSSGQVGSYLVENLPQAIGLDKEPSKYTDILFDLVNKKLAEVLCYYEIEKIIHCAAQVSVEKSVEDPPYDAENNIMGTLNLLEYARKKDIEQFIYISSAAVYGEPQYLPIDEEHPKKPISPYGLSKLVGEMYVEMYHKLYGLKYTIIRPFNIFSPRQKPDDPYSGVITIFVNRAKKGLPLIIYGDGEQTRDFVSIDDVVSFIKLCLEKNISGIFNCGTGKPTKIIDLAKMIIELSGKNLKIEFAPPRKGDIRHSYADISRVLKYGHKIKTNLKEDLNRYFFQKF